jgi:hypothetical protein
VDGLLNWLWQGSVVALAATAIIQSSRTLSATTRYHLWWLTLLLVLALPILPDLQVPRAAASLPVDATSAPQPAWSAPLPGLPAWAKTVVTVLWAAWVTLSLWRVGHALVSLRRAKHDCSVFPPSRETRLRTWISLRVTGRRARLMVVPGVLSSSQLTRRVVRLLDRRRNTSVRRSLVAIALASPLIVTATMMAARVQFVNSAVRVTASVEPGASSAPMSLNSPLRGEDRGHGVGTAVSRSMNRPALKGPSARLSGRPRLPEASSSDSVVPAGKPKSRVPQARTDADADSHEPAVVAATRLELPVAQELPVALTAGGVLPTVASAVDSSASPGAAGSTPWGAAADAGVAVGRGSQKAAVSTAGVFTRFAKSIAGNF